jgi:hypothetical protein
MGRRAWTDEEDGILRRLYANVETAELCRMLDRCVSSLYRRVYYFKLKKDPLFVLINNISLGHGLIKTGKSTRFKKGHRVWNQGMKGWSPAGSEKSRFPKGHEPWQTKHDGAITIRFYKTGHTGLRKRPYYFIRLSKSKWIELHLYLWRQHYGPVPKGMQLTFKDGNSMNCVIDNLELITPQEHIDRARQSNEFIAMCIAKKGTKGKGNYNREIYKEVIKCEEILDAKRQQIKLNQLIKERSCQISNQ